MAARTWNTLEHFWNIRRGNAPQGPIQSVDQQDGTEIRARTELEIRNASTFPVLTFSYFFPTENPIRFVTLSSRFNSLNNLLIAGSSVRVNIPHSFVIVPGQFSKLSRVFLCRRATVSSLRTGNYPPISLSLSSIYFRKNVKIGHGKWSNWSNHFH